MKKRIFSIVLTVVILLTLASYGSIYADAELPFKDVEDTWYTEGVRFCYERGIILGQGNSYTFAPDAPLTRASFAVMLARMLDADINMYNDVSNYADCPVGTWYTASVEWATDNGYMLGIAASEFAPGSSITREQAATVISRLLKTMGCEPEINGSVLDAYSDADSISSWAKESVAAAVSSDIMVSTAVNAFTFSPKMIITRAQAARIFMSIMKNYLFAGCEHKFSYISCTEPRKCTVCSEIVSAMGHTVDNGVCFRCGQEVFSSEYCKIAYYLKSGNENKISLMHEYSNGDSDSLDIFLTEDELIRIKYAYVWSEGKDLELIITPKPDVSDIEYSITYYSRRAVIGRDSINSSAGIIDPGAMTYTVEVRNGVGEHQDWLDGEISYFLKDCLFFADTELKNLCQSGIFAFGFDF